MKKIKLFISLVILVLFLVACNNKDTTAPVISGTKDLTFEIGTTEVDYLNGVSALDNVDGEVEVIIDDSNVNLEEEGTYPLIYIARDKAGNETKIIVTVTVTANETLDTTPPTIYGIKDYVLVVNDEEPDWMEGIYAIDLVDGNVEVEIIENNVNMNEVGIYSILYYAVDSSSNEALEEIIVEIVDDIIVVPEETFIETFDNLQASGAAYVSGTFTGVNGVIWTYNGSRGDTEVQINGTAIAFGGGKSSSTGLVDDSKLSATITGGISSLELTYGRPYNGTATIYIYINGTKVGEFSNKSLEKGQTSTYKLEDINVSGEFKLEFIHENTGKQASELEYRSQVSFDDVTWTTYSGVVVPQEKLDLLSDKEALAIQTLFLESGTITLPVLGAKGSTITWSYANSSNPNNSKINLENKTVTVDNNSITINLIATLKKGEFTETKLFVISLGEGDPISIHEARTLINLSYVNTKGVVTAIYHTQTHSFIFIQDSTHGIYIESLKEKALNVVVGSEIIVKGTKKTVNNQVLIDTIRDIEIVGTKTVNGVAANANTINNHLSQLVNIEGLLSQKYSTNVTEFVLKTINGDIKLVIPANLDSSIKTAINNKLSNKDAGTLISIDAVVYKSGSDIYLLLTNSDSVVIEGFDEEKIASVVIANLKFPDYHVPVTSNIELVKTGLFNANITWTSNKPNAVDTNGVVTRGDVDVEVRLDYVIKINGEVIGSGYLILTVVANGVSYVGTYYNSINSSLTGKALQDALSALISKMTSKSYDDAKTVLEDSDRDPDNYKNVLLVYNRASVQGKWSNNGSIWNREHVWPQSKLGSASKSDLHNLKPANPSINSNRGNLPFANGSGKYGQVSGGYFPGEDDKGDIARILFYMNTRWGLTITVMGNLQMLINWHTEDPVDEFEMNRNNVIYQSQKNRNPYVDNPSWVYAVYGEAKTSNDESAVVIIVPVITDLSSIKPKNYQL